MSTKLVYAVATHRSFDNYFARFVGFATSLQELQTAFPSITKQLAALEHNKTLTFRRPYVDLPQEYGTVTDISSRYPDHRTPDEFVVLRYDVPATATQLHVQYIRWKYAGLTMTATVDTPPTTVPEGVDLLNDCVYDATLDLDPPELPTPPNTPVMTAIPV